MIPSHRSDLPLRSEEDQHAFFDAALEASLTAEARSGAIVRDLSMLGRRIRLIFAGDALEPLLFPALAHKQLPVAGDADLTLHIWDSASTGTAMPEAPVARHCFSDRGDIWTFHSKRIRSAFHWSEYSLSLLDTETGEGLFWLRSTEGLPYWTRAAPLRTLFHFWAERHGAQLVHAAAVGTAEGGLLITGRGGVGKSTTSLACLEAGLDFVGDDYVVLTRGETVAAHNLYRTAKIELADIGRFERFGPQPIGEAHPDAPTKAVAYLAHIAETLPLRMVATPRFGDGRDSFFEPVDAAQLLGAASYTTMAQLPHAGQHTADFLGHALGRLPRRRLVLGRDPAALVATIVAGVADPGPETTARESGTLDRAPLISVIVPVYNGAHFLPEAVESILAQHYPKIEIIVVDDGSTDGIVAAVEALPVQVRFLRKGNAGPAAARNLGLRAAMGEIVAFLDVDDLWPPGKLEASLARLDERPEADVVIGQAQLRERAPDGSYGFVGSPADGFTYYIGAGLYRRRAFTRNGVFDPLLRFAEDLDWYARAERNGLVVDRIDMVTLHVRRHSTNSTRGMDGAALNPLQLARNALAAKRAEREPVRGG